MRGPVCGEGKTGFFGEVGLGAVAGGDGVLGRHHFCFWDCEAMEGRSTSKSIVQSRSQSVETVYRGDGNDDRLTQQLLHVHLERARYEQQRFVAPV